MVKPEKPAVLNQQLPEPFDHATGALIDLHSVWHTLQGEGPFIGTPAIFIRLAGCNLQCPWCDTEYTEGRQRVTVSAMMDGVLELMAKHPQTTLIVLTGGEPTRQNIDPLIYVLLHLNYYVQIESNGVFAPSEQFIEWIRQGNLFYVVSPKTNHVCKEAQYATAFKYVLSADSLREEDGLPLQALGHKAKPFIARPPSGYTGSIYVSPMDASDPVANRANLLACRDSALKHGYTCGIQLHKLLEVA